MRTARQNFFLICTLGVLNALTPFTIDLYLPAFPQIARDLHVDVTRVSLTVSVYFIGFAVGQLFYGPLLDRFGRKKPVYLGLLLYLIASVGCASARSFEALLFFRFLSALGGCAASVGATSMVRDYFPAEDGAKIFSMLMLVLSVSPLIAPTVGGFMVTIWGWRTIFGALSAIATLDLLLLRGALPPGYAPDSSVSLRLGPIFRSYREVFSQPDFRRYTFAGSLSFAGLFVFVAGAPAAFMGGFGVSPAAFGGIFAILAGGMVGGGQLNHLLLRRWNGKQVFRATLLIQVVVGSIYLFGSLLIGFGLWRTVAILSLLLVCAGISFPNAAALALAPFSKNVGSASALLGFLQLGLGSVAAAGLGLVNSTGTLPMAIVIASCSFAGWIILIL